MKKSAVVTGITGQDGSYLSELLLSEGYKVYGVKRRSSANSLGCSSHLQSDPNFEIVESDILDSAGLNRLCKSAKPDHFYNLAAQSHVASSFEQPEYTLQASGAAVLNCLEAIRQSGIHTRFYQASTSEMFGGQYGEVMCNENTAFNPRSPYGCAKLYGYHITKNYRESYKMFACSGILFNHETLSYGMPIIIKDTNDLIDILPIGDIARFYSGVIIDITKKEYQEGRPQTNLKVWDKDGWVDVTWVSGYPHNKDKNPRIINARNFVYTATSSHVCIMEDGSEKSTGDINIGDKVKNIKYPEILNESLISLEEAEWLGMLVGDGNLNNNIPRFTNKIMAVKEKFVDLWQSFVPDGTAVYKDSYSGFTGEYVGQVECYGNKTADYDIYTNDISVFGHRNKKVPKIILNSNVNIMEAFLSGYNICDGLKANKCKYKFRNFKTNSPTLASGLIYLVSKVTGQEYNITVEESVEHGEQQFYYSINLLSDRITSSEKYNIVKEKLEQKISMRKIHRETKISRTFIKLVNRGYIPPETHHLKLCSNEIKKIIDIPNYDGWFFDLETSSGTFHAGIGQGVVHNSERRGPNFVTRKITLGIGSILRGETNKIYLGNLKAKRDWGHAKDFVKGMYLMLNYKQPEDFVLATGETHSVEEFCKVAFEYAGLGDYSKYIEVDPRFYRPAEVDILLGDATKARTLLDWKPEISFTKLVHLMVDGDK